MKTTVFILALTTLCRAAGPASSLDALKAESNPERRAHAAIDYAEVAERAAETAYEKGDIDAEKAELTHMVEAIELAKSSFEASGKTPQRHAATYKYGEQHTEKLLLRLRDLDHRMSDDERPLLEQPRAKVQEIHDLWFEGIMGKKR